jgi:hypothetical protein
MRRRLSWALIAVALLSNRWVIGAIASPDGRIESPLWNVAIIIFQVMLLAVGLLLRSRGPGRTSGRGPAPSLLVGGSLLLSTALAECGARMLDELAPSPRIYPGERKNRTSKSFVVDAELGWRMRPDHRFTWTMIDGQTNEYVSDAEGYRTSEEVERKKDFAAAERRIVLIGDSFTFGTGVDYRDTFGARIESSTTAVKNMAMPGFGIDQMWVTLDRRALALDPDLVVVAFIDEDFDRSLTAYRLNEGFNKPAFIEDGELRPLRAEDRPPFFIRVLEERSWLWSAGRSLARSAAYELPVGEWWTLNRALLHAMVKRCRDADVPLLLVRLPQRPPKRFGTLKKEMAELGADYLDLSSAAPESPIHFAGDDHIDARGHRWVFLRLGPAVRSALSR